jgi:capsular polysaccharide biosynthesis protein/tetratricopeptide (TPR) repeat protein
MAASSKESRLEQATRQMASGDLDGAEGILGDILREEPQSVSAIRLSGTIACLRGNNALAIELIDKLLLVDPDDLQGLLVRAAACNALTDYPAAEASLRHALALNPASYDVHLNLALTFWASGEHDQAEVFFKSALEIAPRSFLANHYLGRIFEAEEDRATAEKYFRSAIELDPASAETRSLLANILFARGNFPEALDHFEALVSVGPDNEATRVLAARAAFELGHEKRAQDLLAAISGEAGQSATSWSNGRQQVLEWWCRDRREDVVRIAKNQNHKFDSVKVLPASAGTPKQPESVTPGVFVARLNDCRVLPGDHLIAARDGSVFMAAVMSRPLHRPYTSPHVAQACDDGRLLLRHPAKSATFEFPCAYLGAAPGYCDWVLECVTRLWAYRQAPEWEKLPVAVQSGMSAWQKDLLAMLGYDDSRLVPLAHDSVANFRELYVASLSAPLNVAAPFALEFLRRTLKRNLPDASHAPRRLFLSRQSAGSRRIANFAEIKPLLERGGFECIDLQTTPARDLFHMIGSAEVILGVEGAAMANVFFASANARIGLVTANVLQSLRYCASSRALGQAFTFLQGDAVFDTSDLLAECDVRLATRTLEDFLLTL